MTRFLWFDITIFSSFLALCILNICSKYCAAVLIADLQKIRCYDGFCKTVMCETITHCFNGRIVPNASYCGCCNACIRILEENEECNEPIVGSLRDITEQRCKEGLKCINGRCSRADDLMAPCSFRRKTMIEKSAEEIYTDKLWLPECAEDGTFKAKQEKKRKAICYSREGRKLFGQEELRFSKNMACGCSRHLDDLKWKNPNTFNTLPQEHCSETGDFEQLQCIGDLCYCANPVTGEVDSRVVKMDYMSRLPCYDKKLYGKNYQKECEKELQRTRRLHFQFFQKGLDILGLEKLRCDFDGTYSSSQCDSNECQCTDKKGIRIHSYFIGIDDFEDLKLNLTTNMTCDCARDVVNVVSHSRYQALKCNSYGTYRRVQCFKAEECFCVDDDGDIISRLLNETEREDSKTLCAELLSNLYIPSLTTPILS